MLTMTDSTEGFVCRGLMREFLLGLVVGAVILTVIALFVQVATAIYGLA